MLTISTRFSTLQILDDDVIEIVSGVGDTMSVIIHRDGRDHTIVSQVSSGAAAFVKSHIEAQLLAVGQDELGNYDLNKMLAIRTNANDVIELLSPQENEYNEDTDEMVPQSEWKLFATSASNRTNENPVWYPGETPVTTQEPDFEELELDVEEDEDDDQLMVVVAFEDIEQTRTATYADMNEAASKAATMAFNGVTFLFSKNPDNADMYDITAKKADMDNLGF